jgi:serine/threonine-protein kinase
VHGESFAKLHKASRESEKPPPPRIVTAIASNMLDGLHAAHEARNERGDPLGLVHRDVTPQNVMVGADGVARMLDFGIAKASQYAHATTREGQIKGKVNYMAPEQVSGEHVDRRTDVYAASVMLWEALTGKRFMPIGEFIATAQLILTRDHPRPSEINPAVPKELDEVILRGLARDPDKRWQNAHEMAAALEKAYPVGSTRDVGEWVRAVYAGPLIERAKSVAEIENLELPAAGSDRPRAASHASLPHIHIPKAPRVPDGTQSNVEAPAGVPKGRPITRYAIVAGGAALALLLIVSLALSTSKHDTAPAPSAAAASSPAPPVIPRPPTPDPSALAQSANPDTPADPSATSTPQDPSPPPAAPPARRLASPRRAPTPAKPGCIPPYTIDANGVRVPKRQCF